MADKRIAYKSIDEYISQFHFEIQEVLEMLRKSIKEAVPNLEEKISWQMPTFALHGNVAHFAAHKKHIGFYPGSGAIDAFKDQLSGYKTSKGAVQFPIEKPLPVELISRMVKFSAAENIKAAEEKVKNKR